MTWLHNWLIELASNFLTDNGYVVWTPEEFVENTEYYRNADFVVNGLDVMSYDPDDDEHISDDDTDTEPGSFTVIGTIPKDLWLYLRPEDADETIAGNLADEVPAEQDPACGESCGCDLEPRA